MNTTTSRPIFLLREALERTACGMPSHKATRDMFSLYIIMGNSYIQFHKADTKRQAKRGSWWLDKCDTWPLDNEFAAVLVQ